MLLPPIISPGSQSEPLPIATALYSPAPRSSFGAFRLFGGYEPPTLTLMQRVAVVIAERIVEGRYPAGSLLSEQPLAEEFGTSKAPVSEALLWVESIGLLANASRRSAQVAPMNLEDFEDLLGYRDLLLSVALEGFCIRRNAENLAIVNNYKVELERLVEDDSRAFSFLEVADRSILYAALHSGHTRVARALCLVSLQFLRYLNFAFGSLKDRRDWLVAWRQALAAVEHRDVTRLLIDVRAMAERRREFASSVLARCAK